MKFGLSLSGLLQHSGDGDMVQRFADVLHLVRVGRELGFDYLYAGQHYLTHPFQMLQPLISLARLSAEAGDMEMLSTILVPLQNPVQMAEDVATLDVLTNGRIIINAALGYRDEEYEAFGVTTAIASRVCSSICISPSCSGAARRLRSRGGSPRLRESISACGPSSSLIRVCG